MVSLFIVFGAPFLGRVGPWRRQGFFLLLEPPPFRGVLLIAAFPRRRTITWSLHPSASPLPSRLFTTHPDVNVSVVGPDRMLSHIRSSLFPMFLTAPFLSGPLVHHTLIRSDRRAYRHFFSLSRRSKFSFPPPFCSCRAAGTDNRFFFL